MKTRLFLFAASLLLFACSNNDNGPEGPQELKIKKFTQNFYFDQSTDNYTLERLFDETGQTVRENVTNHPDLSFYWLYTYNNLGIISEKNHYYGDDTPNGQDIFAYDSNNSIDALTFKNGLGDVISIRDYTTEPDRITFQHSAIYGEIYYDADGRIITNYLSTDTGNSTQTIEYSGDNIALINLNRSNGFVETYTFEYDEGKNPLYDYVQNNYLNATIGDHLGLFNRHDYFSKNNYTRVIYNSSTPDSSYVKTKSTIYNADGFPTSAVVTKNDVLIEELTYEYY